MTTEEILVQVGAGKLSVDEAKKLLAAESVRIREDREKASRKLLEDWQSLLSQIRSFTKRLKIRVTIDYPTDDFLNQFDCNNWGFPLTVGSLLDCDWEVDLAVNDERLTPIDMASGDGPGVEISLGGRRTLRLSGFLGRPIEHDVYVIATTRLLAQ